MATAVPAVFAMNNRRDGFMNKTSGAGLASLPTDTGCMLLRLGIERHSRFRTAVRWNKARLFAVACATEAASWTHAATD